MSDVKIIQCDETVHRLLGKMPEFQRRYGLWIINASQARHSVENSYDTCKPRIFEFYSISHLIGGGGRLWCKGQGETVLHPGQLVVLTPGTVHRCGGADGKTYIEDAIRFSGPVADGLKECGLLKDGVFEFGTIRCLLRIAELIQDPSAASQLEAAIMLQTLLLGLCKTRRRDESGLLMERLLEEIRTNYSRWWTVEEMAEYCNLSQNQLRSSFRHHTGMLPKAYLEEAKLRLAAELLLSTKLPVKEIAEQFGYRDPYHFSKRFKRHLGVSPELYRREISTGIRSADNK